MLCDIDSFKLPVLKRDRINATQEYICFAISIGNHLERKGRPFRKMDALCRDDH